MTDQIDEPIEGAEILWRRLTPDWIKRAEDGSIIVASAAFLDNIDGNVSVHIASLTSIEDVLRAYPHCHVAAIEAQVVIDRGFTIKRDPLPDDPSHALIKPPPERRTKSVRKQYAREIARSARLVDIANR
jgi:hypothetical protein